MTCPRCGRSNPETAGQCAACGASLSPDEPTRATGPGRSTSRTGAGGDRTLTTGAGGRSGLDAGSGARLAPGTLLGTRYEILEVLGEGGMGTVYKAQDRELGRLVALKVIRPEMASRPEILERFKREILLASQVTHKNVLRIHDLGEAGEVRFISMSYVEGTNLKELLERGGPLPLDRGIAVARQIGEALQAAHDAGVVHRDLKPQNILIDRDGNAYIADFGISRSLAEGGTMTDTGTILGTVDYMSPEQARGETPDHRGDIYSFGVILYEMFTGALPFRASNALSVMMKRLHEDAPSVRKARPDLPAWLSSVIARAMQRAPGDRYQSASDLLRDIERRRASRSWRRFARPRVLVPLAAVLLIAAAAAIAPQVLRQRPAAPGRPRVSLAILPFKNATSDPGYDWARSGLPSLLHSELLQSKGLRLIGEDRVLELLETLKVPEGEEARPATLRRMAAILGADSVLSGSLVKIADRLRITADLSRPGSDTDGPAARGAAAPGSPAASAPGAADGARFEIDGTGDDAVFAMVDDLTRRVRDELGLSATLLDRQRSATELTTRSVDALRLYSEGLTLTRTGQPLEAAKRLESALEKDPQFSVARALLAETYDRLGYSDKAAAEADKAVAGVGRASTYEAARIRAVQARLKDHPEAAEQEYRRLTEITPNDAEAFCDLSAVQEERGELQAAMESLKRATSLDPKHPNAHYALGRVQFKLGNPAAAQQEFNAALALHRESGNDEGSAAVLNGLGNASRALGRNEEALKNYRDSLEIRKRIGDRRGVGVALRNISIIQKEQGRYDEAIRSAQEALDISREIGDRSGLAVGYSNLGDIYQLAGRPEEALRAHQDSLKELRESGDPAGLALALANVGYINSVLGHYVEAFFFLKEALQKRREIGDRSEIVRSLIDIGIVEQVQGRYEQALAYYTEGLTLAREIDNKPEMLVLSANLSNIHEEQGEYGAALALLEDARKLAGEIDDKTQIATCLAYLGSTRTRLGDLAGAGAALQESIKLAHELSNTPLLGEALSHQAGLLLLTGQNERAIAVARQAVAAARAAGDRRLVLLSRLRAAEAERSVPGLKGVITESVSMGLTPLTVDARVVLARLHLGAGRWQDAGREAEQAIAAAAPLRVRDLQFQAHHVAGEALLAQGKTAAAGEHFKAALNLFEELRQGLKGDSLKQLLDRAESASFRKAADRVFLAPQGAQERERLRGLFLP